MPPPSPMNQPLPPKRSSLPFLLLAFIVAVAILAYTQGWINFNPGKFKADKDAFVSKAKDALAKGKEKVTGLTSKLQKAKEEEKPAVQKELDEATKTVSELEAAAKKGETTEDEKQLQELQEKMNRLLEKGKKDPPK